MVSQAFKKLPNEERSKVYRELIKKGVGVREARMLRDWSPSKVGLWCVNHGFV